MRLQPLCSPAGLDTPHTLIFVFSVYSGFSRIWFWFWLRRVSVAALRLLAVASRYGAQTLEPVGSVLVAHGLSCTTACGIFLDQVSNPCPLHWQVDSYPLDHQGSPILFQLLVVANNPWSELMAYSSMTPVSASTVTCLGKRRLRICAPLSSLLLRALSSGLWLTQIQDGLILTRYICRGRIFKPCAMLRFWCIRTFEDLIQTSTGCFS